MIDIRAVGFAFSGCSPTSTICWGEPPADHAGERLGVCSRRNSHARHQPSRLGRRALYNNSKNALKMAGSSKWTLAAECGDVLKFPEQ
jgi:hypothetical protein